MWHRLQSGNQFQKDYEDGLFFKIQPPAHLVPHFPNCRRVCDSAGQAIGHAIADRLRQTLTKALIQKPRSVIMRNSARVFGFVDYMIHDPSCCKS